MRSDRGAGAVLALAVLGTVTLVVVAVLTLGAALVVRQRVIGAADAAALAAADAATGAVSGDPCALAAEAARANRAVLAECRLDGLIATVEVVGVFGITPFRAVSTAGPPP
ncbi:MAG: Rv3654c family TadE-like protein [Pseudolysinimonas sp.]